MYVLRPEKQIEIIAALTEGCSIRAIERLSGAHRDSIMRLGVRVGEGCAQLHNRLFRQLPTQLVELDEIWSFIQKKQRHLEAADPESWGDSYTWIALDAINKAVVSYHVGKRSSEDCHLFIRDLRSRLTQQVQITSDGYAPYAPTIRAVFGWKVDYAQLQKVYEEDTEGDRRAQHRYSPGRVVGVEKEIVFGNPEEDKISTSYVERNNLTLRMQIRRFTRLTNAFSRKPENHAAAISLHVAWYNLCRVHETLRTTPAMALGVSSHIWTISELIDAALSTPKPAPTIPVPPTPARPSPRGFQLRVIQGGKPLW
jgi:IS1 family transposase